MPCAYIRNQLGHMSMRRRRINNFRCAGLLAAVLPLTMLVSGPSIAQRSAPGEYYETCRRLGFIPGTTPMRRCIQMQRDTDLDPMSALSEYKLVPEPPDASATGKEGPGGNFSGAESARELLESSPEELLLGPDYRSNSQGIYE